MVRQKYLLKRMVLVAFMLIAGASTSFTFAQNRGDIELIVTGDGPTKKDATLFALRSALEQAYGTLVSSNTKILNDKLVQDEIVSVSTGIIKKYTYLSENVVGGKYYVVVKAIVTPQKLITYARQKGASAELAGASFAANVRLQELNEGNKRIASQNITIMQTNIFPNCLDFSIIDIKEPEHYTYDPSNVYTVNFKLQVRLNSNARIILDLENKKPIKDGGNINTILKSIYNRFKIEDDINEYIPLLRIYREKYEKPDYELSFTKKSKDNTSNNISIKMQSGGGWIVDVCHDPLYYMCDAKGEISDNYRSYPNGNLIAFGQVLWKYAVPNRPIVTIPIKIKYSLNDLDKITGIKVALR